MIQKSNANTFVIELQLIELFECSTLFSNAILNCHSFFFTKHSQVVILSLAIYFFRIEIINFGKWIEKSTAVKKT